MATLRLEIVTPEAKTYSDDVDFVQIPGADGDLGVYPEHMGLMTKLIPGELIVQKTGEEDIHLAVGEGFVEITNKTVSILTDMAVRENDIDESAVEEAIRRAEAAMKDQSLDAEQQASFEGSLQKSLVQLRLKRRK